MNGAASDSSIAGADRRDDEGAGTQRPQRVRDRHPQLVEFGPIGLGSSEVGQLRNTHDQAMVVGWLRGRGGCDSVGDLLDLTAADILAWPQIGVGKRDRILGWIAELAACLPTIVAVAREREAAAVRVDPDLEVLARWGSFAGSATTWGGVESCLDPAAIPDDVAAALTRLRARALPAVTDELDADELLAAWVDSLDDRSRAILRGRLVRAPARTLGEIGSEFGVTRERIRQLERRLADMIPALLAQDAWRSVRWEVFAVRRRFGAYAPLTEDEVAYLSSSEGFPRSLVVWLAGYERLDDRVRAGDFNVPSVGALPTLPDLPVIDMDEVHSRLVASGVAPELVDWTLDSIKGVGRVDGRPVLWPGNIVDKSYAVLAVRDCQMTPDELAAAIGGGVSVRGLRQRLYDDHRFCRVTRHHIGLAAWGGEAYTSVVDLMCTRLEDGPLPLAELAQELAVEFGVSAASVSMYAAAPAFLLERGTLALRPDDRPFVPRSVQRLVPGLYRAGADAMIWNLTVDHDLLRGSGRAMPPEIASFLGMEPGVRITLRNDVRDIPINWLMTSHVGPNIGSLKPNAEAVGARLDDAVRVRFDRAAHAVTITRRPDAVPGEAQQEAIARLTGLPADLCASSQLMAAAVGCEADDLDPALRRRGDESVADLLDGFSE